MARQAAPAAKEATDDLGRLIEVEARIEARLAEAQAEVGRIVREARAEIAREEEGFVRQQIEALRSVEEAAAAELVRAVDALEEEAARRAAAFDSMGVERIERLAADVLRRLLAAPGEPGRGPGEGR